MALFNCSRKSRCTLYALIAGVVIGVLAAFFQLTGAIALGVPFLWILFGIGVGYLAVALVAVALVPRVEGRGCPCATLNALLAGILGTILLAVVLLVFDIAAASVLGAILVGLLLFFFTLTLTSAACLVKCLTGCEG